MLFPILISKPDSDYLKIGELQDWATLMGKKW